MGGCVCVWVGGCVCGWVVVCVWVGGCLCMWQGFVSLIFRKLFKAQFALMCGFCLLSPDM